MSGTTVYLSATEPTHYYERAAQAGNQYYLVSYLYLKQRNSLRNIEYRKNENPDHIFLIDSGAHTLQGDDLKAFDVDDYKRYMDNYADWLVKNQQYIHACVELDVESAVGMRQVREWHEDFFIPFEKMGNNVIFVWHPDRGLSEFEDMCRKHSWVGIAQDFFDSGNDLGRFMQIARKNLTKVHGFGITALPTLLKNTFYSVDSTTWKGGEMYGVSYIWDEVRKTIRPIVATAAQQRYQYRQYFNEIGLDTEEIVRGESRPLTTLALHSWKRLQNHLHTTFIKPTYWDIRPPVPAIAVEAEESEALKYMALTKILEGSDLSNEEIASYYVLCSALLNHEYDDIRGNAESFNDLVRSLSFFVAEVDIEDDTTDFKLEKLCCDFSSLVLAKALPKVDPIKRTGQITSEPKLKTRTDFPQDGLSFTTYQNIYREYEG